MSRYRGDEPLPVANASEEDATDFMVQILRRDATKFARNSYGIYLRAVLEEYLFHIGKIPRTQQPAEHWIQELSPPFLEAAWSLCRLGVLRPGVERIGVGPPTTKEGDGYSLTTFGRAWIRELDDMILIPWDATRMSKMLLEFSGHFGQAYSARARDGARCYTAYAFIACCAMVGAAAEAILLAAASAKLGEEKALTMYKSGPGRSRLERALLGQSTDRMRRDFAGHTNLISYWRDQASHGHVSLAGESEAYMALRGLLRFALFARDNWAELTSSA